MAFVQGIPFSEFGRLFMKRVVTPQLLQHKLWEQMQNEIVQGPDPTPVPGVSAKARAKIVGLRIDPIQKGNPERELIFSAYISLNLELSLIAGGAEQAAFSFKALVPLKLQAVVIPPLNILICYEPVKPVEVEFKEVRNLRGATIVNSFNNVSDAVKEKLASAVNEKFEKSYNDRNVDILAMAAGGGARRESLDQEISEEGSISEKSFSEQIENEISTRSVKEVATDSLEVAVEPGQASYHKLPLKAGEKASFNIYSKKSQASLLNLDATFSILDEEGGVLDTVNLYVESATDWSREKSSFTADEDGQFQYCLTNGDSEQAILFKIKRKPSA